MAQDREDGKTARRAGGKAGRAGKPKAGANADTNGWTGSVVKTGGRGGGFRQAAYRARPALDKVASGHGFAQPDVLIRWAEIVGEALAPTCRPVRVSYGGKRGLGATLVVQASGARAPEVEHLTPRIIERVNSFYGYRAISRLRIVQSGVAELAESGTGLVDPDFSPSPADTQRAEEMTARVEDTELRAALTRLGAHVLARGRRHTQNIKH